jgi:hypothetical protein
MVWAENINTSDLEYHTSHGSIKVTLDTNGGSSGGNDTSERDADFLHGLIMWISWFVFGFVQIASNRWFMHLSKSLFAVHFISGLLIMAATIYCVFLLINQFGGLYLSHIHNLIGFIVLCMVVLVSIGGIATTCVKRNVTWNTSFIVRFKIFHRTFGFLIWLLGIFATCFGLKSYSELWLDGSTNYLIWVNGSAMVIIFLVCELTFRKLRSGEDQWVTKDLQKVLTES